MCALFSDRGYEACRYKSFRPTYPSEFFAEILKYHDKGGQSGDDRYNLCVDVGCGTGQSSVPLAKYFKKVIATDRSNVMLDNADKTAENVMYVNTPAEDIKMVESGSADVVVSGQACHWFDHAKFFPEIHRILKPNGTLAIWCYECSGVSLKPSFSVMNQFLNGAGGLGPYWPEGVKLLRNEYRDIQIPSNLFADIVRLYHEEGAVSSKKSATQQQYRDYLTTFSAYYNWRQDLKNKETSDIAAEVTKELWTAEQLPPEASIDLEFLTAIIMARKRPV